MDPAAAAFAAKIVVLLQFAVGAASDGLGMHPQGRTAEVLQLIGAVGTVLIMTMILRLMHKTPWVKAIIAAFIVGVVHIATIVTVSMLSMLIGGWPGDR